MVAVFCTLLGTAAFADFDEGRKAYDKKDWPNAILNLRPAAEAGDARSMILLANMYAEGYGVGKDVVESFSLYRRAAALNNLDATLAVATMYQQGLGVEANTEKAVQWFERAAKMGSQPGAFLYAIHLFQGAHAETFDIKPDHVAAYQWFLIAAKGNVKPMADAARQMALKLGEKQTAEDKAKAETFAAAFTPADPATLTMPD